MTLALTQLLSIELGWRCNLAGKHARCPASLGMERYRGLDTSRELDDLTVLECVCDAYEEHGFTGLIAWHYYNEPSLQTERMLGLMEDISRAVPQARFLLWSNGTRQVPDRDRLFAQVWVSDYRSDPEGLRLDDRLRTEPDGPESDRPCCRPFAEFVLDAFGNHHPCCADWRGRASLGNVFRDGFDSLVRRWGRFQRQTCGWQMSVEAPPRCRRCQSHFRNTGITCFDELSARRAVDWRQGLRA